MSKLRAITVERGATRHEAATAATRAQELVARFGLDGRLVPPPSRAVREYAVGVMGDRRSARSLRFVGLA